MERHSAPRANRVVPVHAEPAASVSVLPMPGIGLEQSPQSAPRDARGRPLSDLRISVTDRCNFRCTYCMPRERFGRDHAFLPQAALLTFEEITRAARAVMPLGVRKLRVTGGEPLLRRNLPTLIEQLSALRTPEGQPADLALTTNGVLLPRLAAALRQAGLQRLTISLDALDEATFARMSDAPQHTLRDVLAGIDAAHAAGFQRIKVNMVVKGGVNDHQVLPMVAHFRGSGVELRFIEFMDVGQTNQWSRAHVVPAGALRQRIAQHWPLRRLGVQGSDTAERWEHADGLGTLGFIASVTQPFCGDCTRLRLSTEGRLYTCLFAHEGHDLRALLRDARASDEALTAQVAALWERRSDRYSELRGTPVQATAQRVEMSYIGG